MMPINSKTRHSKVCGIGLSLLCLLFSQALAFAQSVKLGSSYNLNYGPMPTASTVADVDRDGNMDLLVNYKGKMDGSQQGGLYWYQGPKLDGRLIYAEKNFQNFFTSLIVDDFNQDGKMDLIGLEVYLFITKSIADPGNKTFKVAAPLENVQVAVMATGDLNKDGYPDIAGIFRGSGDYGPNTLYWFENSGGTDPTFTQHQIPSAITHTSGGFVFVADMNGDGNLDIILTGYEGSAVYVNDGAKTPTFTEDYRTTGSIGAVRDFNGDGKTDMVMGVKDGMVLLENTGAKKLQFTPHPLTGISNSVSDLTVCDLDQDGDLDLAGLGYDQEKGYYPAYLENKGGWPTTYQYHKLGAWNDSSRIGPPLIAPLRAKNRYQVVVAFWDWDIFDPYGWITIYDTIVPHRNGVKIGAWSAYR